MKVKCRVILDKESANLSYHKYTIGNIKYLLSRVQSPVNFWIYGNIILLVLFGAKPLLSIKVKSKLLADGFKNYFENLWKIAKKQQKSNPFLP